MKIISIAGFAVITKDSDESSSLYKTAFGLPLEQQEDYLFMDKYPGANHFGVWPLRMVAETCFGSETWPDHIPAPTATIEFELSDAASVQAAVQEMREGGQEFIHEAREEPWGQTVARFISPEGVLIGLNFAPWLHEDMAAN